MTREQAAGIFEHYIRIALKGSGVPMTADMDRELGEARAAFEDKDERIRDILKRSGR